MKKIIAIALSLISSSAMANNYNGVWAVNSQSCLRDWVRITPTFMAGRDWKCDTSTITESKTEKLVSAFCGYDNTDVTFQDVIKISKVDDYIIFSFQRGRVALFKCKQFQ
jgi:hypothetical protein